jgi:uncharacterized protein (DUF427 family)
MKAGRIEPGPGQESVWDYPRPPAAVEVAREVVVRFGGKEIGRTTRPVKVMETSHPPVYYVPPGDVDRAALVPSSHRTVCEYKGTASYYDVVVGDREAKNAAWYYPAPNPGYEVLRDCVAFYPQAMDECTVDGEVVTPQPGHFYGGWVTSEVVGPFKGAPGTMGW